MGQVGPNMISGRQVLDSVRGWRRELRKSWLIGGEGRARHTPKSQDCPLWYCFKTFLAIRMRCTHRRRPVSDLDETPVVRKVGEIEEGEERGCLTVRERKKDGSEGFPWVV
jgi:hypothetical protein